MTIDSQQKYKLIVFDLDYTLWDCGTWIDQTTPPFHKKGELCYDNNGTCLKLYNDVELILNDLNKNYTLAIASRTHTPDLAKKLLNMYEINHYFSYKEIFPSDKTSHFKNLYKETGFAYEEMIFFDDEYRNIEDVQTLGVNTIFVKGGISKELVFENL